MIKKSLLVTTIAVIAGCSNHSDYEGQGEYLELSKTNVVERDLTAPYVQPTLSTLAKTAPVKKPNPNAIGKVQSGETYEHALKRWLKLGGYNYTAWSVDEETEQALQQISPTNLSLNGTLQSRVAQVGIHLEKPIQLTVRNDIHIAAIHQFKSRTSLVLAQGSTLKDAVKNLVHDYGAKWDDEKSYRATDNYVFTAPYPIITKQDDIQSALDSLLYGYPVQANILKSSNLVFVEDYK